MISEQDLAAMKARANAATPGPWKFDGKPEQDEYKYLDSPMGTIISLDDVYPGYPECGQQLVMEIIKVDADFIAHARDDVPTLIAAYREQQAEIERLKRLEGGKGWST